MPGLIARETDAGDEIPRLISTDGGTAQWQDTKELKASAAKGDPQACFELGTRMVFGDDEVAVDLAQAHVLLAKAAAGGVPDAHFRLGKLYHDGAGVPRDYEKALEFYTTAARLGVAEAQHNIGSMLVSARGVKRNYVEGLAWLLVAEENGAEAGAAQQVRERLAKRPDDIRAAETRAMVITADLPNAIVKRIDTPPRAPAAPPALPPKAAPRIEVPSAPSVVAPPATHVVPPPQLSLPIEPPPPASNGSARPAAGSN